MPLRRLFCSLYLCGYNAGYYYFYGDVLDVVGQVDEVKGAHIYNDEYVTQSLVKL